MCANYQPPTVQTVRDFFTTLPIEFTYKPEAYPGYDAPVLVASTVASDELEPVRASFGLIPVWAKDRKIERRTYNARAETIATLNSYRTPWRKRQRCLVPVQAFYEPNYELGKPVRWAIQREDGQPFALAAIWDRWSNPVTKEWERSFSLVTINASGHSLMERFHAPEDEKRSVVVVGKADHLGWLNAATGEEAREYLKLFDADQFTASSAPRPPAVRKPSGS